jgi:kumamolisin
MSDRREISEKSDPKPEGQSSALREEAAGAFGPRVGFVNDRAVLLDTETGTPSGTRVGPTDANKEITSTIMVRSKGSEKELDDTLQKVVNHQIAPLTDAQFDAQFGADPQAMQRVTQFVKDNGLQVVSTDSTSGRVVVKGSVKDFSKAFEVKLDDYQTANGGQSRERTGDISVPKNVAQDIQGVFGLESREAARPHFQWQPENPFSPRANSGYLPGQVADAYNFPKDSMGAGQSVGIIELGGGLDTADNATYYQKNGLKLPTIQMVGVDGAASNPGGSADGEVALDTQVIGAVAPDANQQLVFAPPTDQGFVDAITRATFPQDGEKQNTAISISWGGRETSWTQQAINNMDLAFKKAAVKGISVFAASGDTGAGDLNPGQANDGKLIVDFPAADPWVTGTGGTKLTIDAGGKNDEVTWNESKMSASGGGISQIFGVPDFQKDIKMSENASPGAPTKVGRGVPDVAGDADPFTGYKVRVNGVDGVIGGTSAVAPLYAGLMMRVNGALGHPVGYLNPFLYKNPQLFRDITSGSNNGYPAGPGWDAATGLGVINGTDFLNALKKEGH